LKYVLFVYFANIGMGLTTLGEVFPTSWIELHHVHYSSE
jgi:hypothetical protein